MNDIFRKKSLDRVNSPEDLGEYMKVVNPPIWFAIVAVILILLGALVWSATTKLETKVQAIVISQKDGLTCYISEDNIASVSVGTIVKADGNSFTVKSIAAEAVTAEDVLSDYEITLAGFYKGETIYAATLEGNLAVGCYPADVILNEVSPISFLFSRNF